MRNISIRINDETREKLDQLAAGKDRSRNWVVKEALEQYIHHQDWIIEAIKEGEKDADAGNLIPHEEVMSSIEAIIETARQKAAKT